MCFFVLFRRGQAKFVEIFAARISKIVGKHLGSRFPCSLSRFSLLGWCSGCCLWRHRLLLLDALAWLCRAILVAAKFWEERLSPKFWVGRHSLTWNEWCPVSLFRRGLNIRHQESEVTKASAGPRRPREGHFPCSVSVSASSSSSLHHWKNEIFWTFGNPICHNPFWDSMKTGQLHKKRSVGGHLKFHDKILPPRSWFYQGKGKP